MTIGTGLVAPAGPQIAYAFVVTPFWFEKPSTGAKNRCCCCEYWTLTPPDFAVWHVLGSTVALVVVVGSSPVTFWAASGSAACSAVFGSTDVGREQVDAADKAAASEPLTSSRRFHRRPPTSTTSTIIPNIATRTSATMTTVAPRSWRRSSTTRRREGGRLMPSISLPRNGTGRRSWAAS